MTTETRGVTFGGGGASAYYVGPSRRRINKDEDSYKKRIARYSRIITRLEEPDEEVFLFTIQDPLKTVINRLLDLFRVINFENPPEDYKQFNLPIASGPMGYTKIIAFRPTMPKIPVIIFKPVIR